MLHRPSQGSPCPPSSGEDLGSQGCMLTLQGARQQCQAWLRARWYPWEGSNDPWSCSSPGRQGQCWPTAVTTAEDGRLQGRRWRGPLPFTAYRLGGGPQAAPPFRAITLGWRPASLMPRRPQLQPVKAECPQQGANSQCRGSPGRSPELVLPRCGRGALRHQPGTTTCTIQPSPAASAGQRGAAPS